MLRSALRASAATLGLAIFVDVPSKNQPHALKLKRADAAGATYRGVAANATQSSLRNFQLSLDAVFAPCDEATFEAYDRLTAHELFIRMGLSKRLVDDFIRPTLLVGLFKPPEELSAAVVMELLYYYALAHQDSFDVRWIKTKSIAEVLISPLCAKLQREYGLKVMGGTFVKEVDVDEGERRATAVRWVNKSGEEGELAGADAVVVTSVGADAKQWALDASDGAPRHSPRRHRHGLPDTRHSQVCVLHYRLLAQRLEL